MDKILTKLSTWYHASFNRPLCPSCQLSRTDNGQQCNHCVETHHKKSERLQQFLDKRKEDPWLQKPH